MHTDKNLDFEKMFNDKPALEHGGKFWHQQNVPEFAAVGTGTPPTKCAFANKHTKAPLCCTLKRGEGEWFHFGHTNCGDKSLKGSNTPHHTEVPKRSAPFGTTIVIKAGMETAKATHPRGASQTETEAEEIQHRRTRMSGVRKSGLPSQSH